MTYTKEGWKPVTTELNDPLTERERRIVALAGGEQDYLHHEDWCEDPTCLHGNRP